MAAPLATVVADDPVTEALAKAPMSRLQIAAVVISVALNALDGFDVLAITFAAPGITRAWGIGPAQLGIALSSGLVGMSIGSLALGPLGDRLGRRPLVLICLVLMAAGMLLTATATEACLAVRLAHRHRDGHRRHGRRDQRRRVGVRQRETTRP